LYLNLSVLFFSFYPSLFVDRHGVIATGFIARQANIAKQAKDFKHCHGSRYFGAKLETYFLYPNIEKGKNNWPKLLFHHGLKQST